MIARPSEMPKVHDYLPTFILVTLMLVSNTSDAMGILSSGTNACYAIRNIGTKDIQDLRVISADDPRLWYESALRQRASTITDYSSSMPGSTLGFGGSCYRHDSGHQVPDAVLVSWRELPEAGGKAYSGRQLGPYRIEIRARVPEEVLALARRHPYSLEFSFTAGALPIYFNWQLISFGATDRWGINRLCVGGDSFEELRLEEWLTAQEAVPVWPRCRFL